jgi:hypothetical protein
LGTALTSAAETSRYNPDHKVTFTPHKSASWSPVSRNITDLITVLPGHKLIFLKTCDDRYIRSGGVWDRTIGEAEAAIEFLLEKSRSYARPNLTLKKS